MHSRLSVPPFKTKGKEIGFGIPLTSPTSPSYLDAFLASRVISMLEMHLKSGLKSGQ